MNFSQMNHHHSSRSLTERHRCRGMYIYITFHLCNYIDLYFFNADNTVNKKNGKFLVIYTDLLSCNYYD